MSWKRTNCAICSATKNEFPDRRLFRFPKRGTVKYEEWLALAEESRGHIESLKRPYICSKHFKNAFRGPKYLQKNAYPSLFLKRSEDISISDDVSISLDSSESTATNQNVVSVTEDAIHPKKSKVVPKEAKNKDTQMKVVFDVPVEEVQRTSIKHQLTQMSLKETEEATTCSMLCLPNQRSNIQAEVSIIKLEEEQFMDAEDFIDVKNECVTPEDFVSLMNEPETSDIFQDALLMKSNQDALQYLKPLRTFLLSQKNSRALELLTHMELILEQEGISKREAESNSRTQLTEGAEILPNQPSNNQEESKEEVSIIELRKERLGGPLLEVFKSEPYELINIVNSDCRNSEICMDVQNKCATSEDFVSETNGIFQDYPHIKSNQDALQLLKPLRTFLLLQKNARVLGLLTQMELLLVKSEIT